MGMAATITLGRWIIALLAAVLAWIALSYTGRLSKFIDGRGRTQAGRGTVATSSKLAHRGTRWRRQRAERARVVTACSKLAQRVSS